MPNKGQKTADKDRIWRCTSWAFFGGESPQSPRNNTAYLAFATWILPYPPLPRALCFQCFKKKRTKTAIFRCYSCIEIPKPFPWRTWSTAPKRSDSPWCPPLGDSGDSVVVDVPNPDVLVSVRSTLKLHGGLGEKMYVYLLLQVHLEDWYLHVGLCVFIHFFLFRLATKFGHRRPFLWKDRFNAIKGQMVGSQCDQGHFKS